MPDRIQGQSSSATLLSGFLMGMDFSLSGRPRVNNPNVILAAVGMREKQDALFAGRSDRVMERDRFAPECALAFRLRGRIQPRAHKPVLKG
jgi:hypothetical protein